LIIAVANREVLDNHQPGSMTTERGEKVFNPSDYSVSWKPEVFAYYQSHPDEFARNHPDLVLGPDPYIGKACTCFVDASLFALLSQVPHEQRLCDLRLVSDAQDLALAILGSTAEPTYFPPVPETRLDKTIIDGRSNSLGRSRRRSYYGGFGMPLGAQDCRRALPSLRVMSSGWVQHPMAVRKIVRASVLLDIEHMAQLGFWWTDLDVTPSRTVQIQMVEKNLAADGEFAAGYQRAAECLKADRGLPEYVTPPHFGSAVQAKKDADRLPTMRGLGPLVAPPRITSPASPPPENRAADAVGRPR
jgi:hypothetical protein